MKVAIIGLMQSGKSTLVSAISGKAVPPVGSVAIEEVSVPVPDERLEGLPALYQLNNTCHGPISGL